MEKIMITAARTVAAVLGTCSIAAHAQVSSTAENTERVVPEEVVVTAQRRAEDIQRVPISVAAYGPQLLERLEIKSTDQLQFATPGFVNTQTAGDGIAAVYIRGVGTGYSGPGLEGSVAFYVDDVYLQTQTSSAQETIDIAQIQVLKGPQGTLYGRNATGGAVLVTTNDPKLDRTEGYIKVGYGNHNWMREESVLNTPISATLANRFVQFYQYRDGYVRNSAFPDQRESGVGAGDTWGIRDKLLWQPTDAFKAVLTGEYNRRAGYGSIHSLRYNGDGTPTNLGFYETRQSRNREGGGGEDSDALLASLRTEYSWSTWTLSNTLAYRRARSFGCTDNDGVPEEQLYFCLVSRRYSPNAGTTDGKADRTITNEFRIVSETGGPLDVTAGAFFERNHARFAGRIGGSFFGTLTPTFDNRDDLTAYSVFVDAYYKLSSRLKLTAGVRYTDEEKEHRLWLDADAVALMGGGVPTTGRDTASFNNFSPRVVLSYDADAVSYYASFNRGFKSGGFNSPSLSIDPLLKPETITAFEVGAKYRSEGGALNLNTAVFHYDWKNQQVAFITGGGAGILQQNAAKAEIYGAEVTADYSPSSAWHLNAGAAYTHARYSSFPNAAVYDLIGGFLTANAADLKDERLPQAPDVTGNLNLTREFDLSGGYSASVTAGARYTSTYDFTAGGGGELAASRQRPFTMVNLSGKFYWPNQKFELGWFVSNLLDREYYSLISTGNTGVYMTPAEPRVYGATLQYSF